MSEIQARSRSIRETLSNSKYGIDYYQREYRWETKNIRELLEDLSNKFLNNYDPQHEPREVEKYENYFLGSIVISNKEGKKYVIDGQQRLTSISLILIFLHNIQKQSIHRRVNVSELIFSERFGEKSFNIDVEERTPCMEALFNEHHFDFEGSSSESVRTIGARYEDIKYHFPDDLQDEALPYFIDWMINKVMIVHIEADNDEDAYTIFETMNDRGLSLNPTDMLKGYLLANIRDNEAKERANTLWKKRILKLIEKGKNEEIDFFKHWFRAKFAQSIRERGKGKENKDFEKVATSYHKWVRDNKDSLSLHTSQDFEDFITKQFDFYSRQYLNILKASVTYTKELEYVYYNNHNNFTHQYHLLLAPLKVTDTQDIINRKINLVAYYIDMLIVNRFISFSTLNYSSLAYTMYNLTKDIRDKDLDELKIILQEKGNEINKLENLEFFYLHQQNKKYVHYLLARITHHIEIESGIDSNFKMYVTKESKNPFQIEHIWANKFQRHTQEFSNETDFQNRRNHVGGLLLLPKSINQSYGDKEYFVKVQQYFGQNLLAKSLHKNCYENNPNFLRYIKNYNLPFKPYATFNTNELIERQELYKKIVQQVWDLNKINDF
ncbi:TPA: DUF262 domain-containing protein [Bacillus cereus]|uniref:DUF262 domain-containing protein n=1 Tax=Bacillus paranthracis TaxID=2026186 RepID=UPI000B449386|nr:MULTISPECIES: DUF262 domain-containing protein [Bacillus cereus group]MED1299779.1 DUF262 domain-containing protein [Bacillus pacificus]HDR8214840.1 DUF262 domain-containing protein [Bacillus cereus]MCC2537147.1 DUF262 domain-containing protein [Bacillus paranthracis]HDR8226771.1 DUF262 domain-containing protein [Bacillus cereus]HDR8238842.1 DUF262 domain-containing protein [Bacillus cereus]